MATTESHVDSESLVARIIAELDSQPEARTMLLRALLADEFQGIPVRLERTEARLERVEVRLDRVEVRLEQVEARLDRVEARLEQVEARLDRVEARLEQVEARLDRVEARLEQVEVDVAQLKGDSLELKLPRRIRPLLSQFFGLRRPRVMQGSLLEPVQEFSGAVESATEEGIIDDEQEGRIVATDLIVQAQRKAGGERVWVAVEASNHISQRDIERARDSADALGTVFKNETLAVVVGYRVHDLDRRRADEANVHVLLLGEYD